MQQLSVPRRLSRDARNSDSRRSKIGKRIVLIYACKLLAPHLEGGDAGAGLFGLGRTLLLVLYRSPSLLIGLLDIGLEHVVPPYEVPVYSSFLMSHPCPLHIKQGRVREIFLQIYSPTLLIPYASFYSKPGRISI